MAPSQRRPALRLFSGLTLSAFTLLTVVLLWMTTRSHDLKYHLPRLQEILTAWRAGDVHLVFSNAFALGRDLPTYVYYSQWVYWPAAALTALGLPILSAYKVTLTATLAGFAAGLWHLFKSRYGRDWSVTLTLLTLSSSYLLGLLFVRGAFPEFAALTALTWGLYALQRQRRGAFAACCAAMILTHPLTFLNCTPLIAVFYALSAPQLRLTHAARDLVLPVSAALMATAFFWAPAFIESHFVLGAGGLHPRPPSFVRPIRLLALTDRYSLGWPLNVSALVSLAALAHPTLRRRAGAGPWAFALLLALYVFLCLKLSRSVWDLLEPLKGNIFSFRLLLPASLSAALLVGEILKAAPADRAQTAGAVLSDARELDAAGAPPRAALRIVVGALLVALCGAALVIPLRSVRREFASLTFERVFEDRKVLELLRNELYHRTAGYGVSEYLPNLDSAPVSQRRCAMATLEARSAEERRYALPARAPCVLLPTYWSSRFEGRVEGRVVPLSAAADSRMVLIEDVGDARFAALKVREPWYGAALRWLSLATVALAALCALAAPGGALQRWRERRQVAAPGR